jgi:hypothetical protein
MEYDIYINNSNVESNFNSNFNSNFDQTTTDNEYKDFIYTKKNIKNKNNNTDQVVNLQNKINELENKLQFYKKYENNLSNDDLRLLNNSVEIIDNLVKNLTKNMISKGQFNRDCKHIEFEF